jgi:EmrB/QacA subfamily drug resistance transporter
MENKKRNQILLVLFLGVLMGALDIAIVGPALPAIRAQFGVEERALSWMFSVYVLFNLIGTPLMAKLSDIFGRRIIYMIDVALFGVGSLIVAASASVLASPSFAVVILGRAIQGFGAGGIFPVASAVIGDTFPPEKRGGALGLIGAVFGLAFVIGPILGGILLQFGWTWLFLINLPIAVVVIFLSFRLLPSVSNKSTGKFDWLGMAVISVALASLAYGINQIDTKNFFGSLVSLSVLPFLLVSMVLLFFLARIEKGAENPVLPLGLFNRRQLSLAYALSAGAGLGESSLVYMPLLAVVALGSAYGITGRSASFLLMPVVLAMGFGAPLMGRMLDKMGSRVVILSGTAIMTVGMLLLGLFASSMVMFIISGVLIGLGLSALLGAPIRYIMLNEVDASERSVSQGVVTLFTSIGQLIGSAMVGAVAQSGGGNYATAFLAISGLGVVLVVLSVFLKPRAVEKAQQTNLVIENA